MSWAGTQPKTPKEIDTSLTEDEDLTTEQKDRKTTTDYLDEDYPIRMPSTRFANLKRIENLVLQLPKFQPLVKTHVICTGILYGNGERTFYEHFRKAWIGDKLPLLGDGSNVIPCIHVVDVARLVKRITTEHIKQQYIIAVDQSQITQKQIVNELVQGEQSKLQNVDILEVYSEEWSDYVNIDIKMRPSLLLLDKAFQWHCKTGIVENMSQIVEEFKNYRGLQPIKVSIIGAPVSGKTELAQYLQSITHTPVLTVKNAIDYAKTVNNQLAADIHHQEEELKNKQVEELEKQRKKAQDIDRDALKVKIDDYLVTQAIKKYLQ